MFALTLLEQKYFSVNLHFKLQTCFLPLGEQIRKSIASRFLPTAVVKICIAGATLAVKDQIQL
jgi:hypothetical protein